MDTHVIWWTFEWCYPPILKIYTVFDIPKLALLFHIGCIIQILVRCTDQHFSCRSYIFTVSLVHNFANIQWLLIKLCLTYTARSVVQYNILSSWTQTIILRKLLKICGSTFSTAFEIWSVEVLFYILTNWSHSRKVHELGRYNERR